MRTFTLIFVIITCSFVVANGKKSVRGVESVTKERELAVSSCSDKQSCALCMESTSQFVKSDCHWCGNTCVSTFDKLFHASCDNSNAVSPGISECVDAVGAWMWGSCSDYKDMVACNAQKPWWHRNCRWKLGGSDQCPRPVDKGGVKSPISLKPDVWMLNGAEIKNARGGVDSDVSKVTYKNKVKFIPDGKTWFDEWVQDIESSGKGDVSLLSGWLNGPESLIMNPLDPLQRTLGHYWKGAMERGVRCNALTWRNLIEDGPVPAVLGNDPRKFAKGLVDLTNQVVNSGGVPDEAKGSRVYIDGRQYSPSSSIHQKFAVQGSRNHLKALVGGIDLTYARWDEYLLDNPETLELRTKLTVDPYASGEGRGGWVDRAVKLEGDSAALVYKVFAERWESNDKPAHFPPWVVDTNGAWEDRKPLPKTEKQQVRFPEKHAVQVLRTVPCKYACNFLNPKPNCNFPYAKKGDLTILEGIRKAIGLARNYIYIEDQYGLVQHEIQNDLHEALANNGLNYLVVLLAPALKQPNGNALQLFGCGPSQYEMWSPLKKLFPDRVKIIQRKDARFVHSKTWIIDDVYFNTGSANINDRSYFQDQEVNVAVVDEETVQGPDNFQVGKFALMARVRAWAEMTGLSEKEVLKLKLDDAVGALDSSKSKVKELTMSSLKDGTNALGLTTDEFVCGTVADSGTDCPYVSSFASKEPHWGPFGAWGTTCSKKCGGGIVSRSRHCTLGTGLYAGKYCSGGSSIETKKCNTRQCKTWTSNYQWFPSCPSGYTKISTSWSWGKRSIKCKEVA